MKSDLLKALLLTALLTITVVSFFPRMRVKEATPTTPSAPPAPRITAEPPPPPAAPWTEKWNSYVYAGERFSFEMPAMPFVYESSRRMGLSGNVEPVRTFGLYSDGVERLVERERTRRFAEQLKAEQLATDEAAALARRSAR